MVERSRIEVEAARPNIYIFVGLEGSGKSTQGKLLAKTLGLPFVSTGGLLREREENDPTEVGDRVRAMFEKGGYLESDLLLRILRERISEPDTQAGFVLDGALRKYEESEVFEEFLRSACFGNAQINVISLRVPVHEAFERAHRRGRTDDTPDKIVSRMTNYYRGAEEDDRKLGLGLGERMKIARRLAQESGGRFEIVISRGNKKEVNKEILEKLGKGVRVE
jgi:adenylate kinase